MIKAYKLYTGADGNSHVEVGSVQEDFMTDVVSIKLKESKPHSSFDWHNAPVEQYVITIAGRLQFETKTGETFVLKPGDILIALDTKGTAHQWKLIDNEPWKRAYVVLKENSIYNFIPDSVV